MSDEGFLAFLQSRGIAVAADPEDALWQQFLRDVLRQTQGTPLAEGAKKRMPEIVAGVVKARGLGHEQIKVIITACEKDGATHQCPNPGCDYPDVTKLLAEMLKAHVKVNLQ